MEAVVHYENSKEDESIIQLFTVRFSVGGKMRLA